MAEVVVDRVTKRFGDVEANKDISLTVPNGEFMVLLGPTGAGKTTLLRLIAGLEKPDAGNISFDDCDVTDDPPAQRNVSVVFQQYSLYPHLTVFDNLAFPLRAPVRRVPESEIKKRVEEVARLVRIDHKLANSATRLSGGVITSCASSTSRSTSRERPSLMSPPTRTPDSTSARPAASRGVGSSCALTHARSSRESGCAPDSSRRSPAAAAPKRATLGPHPSGGSSRHRSLVAR